MKAVLGLGLMALSLTAYAGWTKAVVVDSGPNSPVSLIMGKGRNDDTVRLYWVGSDCLLRETTYRNGSWHTDMVDSAGTNIVIAPARNDSINRIYAVVHDSLNQYLYEYTWTNGSHWKKTIDTLSYRYYLKSLCAAKLRNDDTIRLYLIPDWRTNIYELTYRSSEWEPATDSLPRIPEAYPSDVKIGIGRNDDTLRLYLFRNGEGFEEHTCSSGHWRQDLTYLDVSGLYNTGYTTIVIGDGKGDKINHLYIGVTETHSPGIEFFWCCKVFEFTYSDRGWWYTTPYSSEIYPNSQPYSNPLLTNRVGDDTARLYAYLDANTTTNDTCGLYEFTYQPAGWKQELVDSERVTSLIAGQGRNDDTNRLYGIQNNKIIEFTRTPTGINEQTRNLSQIQPALQITPNPFSTRTEIRYQISPTDKATVQIFDAAGRMVKIFPKTLSPASKVYWFGDDESGKKVPTGIYFCQLKTGSQTLTKKIILVK